MQNIQAIGSYEDLRSKLISFGPKFTNDDEKATILNYYKVGNKPLQTVTYSNNKIKDIITNVMIPYCENFYSTFKDDINKQLNDLGVAMENISKTYVTECVRELSNISIITEAEAAAEKTTNLTTKAGWMSRCLQMYSGSVLNSIRDRNNDYFKVLYALAPKKANTPAPDTTPTTPEQPAEQK
jgi:hypothetical protein